jgi:glycine cleavage system H protein
MDFPNELLYTKEHEWIKVEGDTGYVGITDFAQSELGDIVYVEIETVGQELEQGVVFGTVEAVKTVSDLFLPLTGTVLEVNDTLGSEPETVNKDPYQKGWMIKMHIKDQNQLKELLSVEDYKKLVNA